MRFLLRPGWLALIVAVIGFAAACYLLLAPWQFRRNAEQESRNAAIQSSFTHPPAPLRQLVPAGQQPSADVEWRQATVTGSYLPEAETVARLRSVDSDPAFEVLTPLRAEDGRVVLVDRGYVRPVRGVEVPPYAAPPAGTVSLTGRIRRDEVDPEHRAAVTANGHRQVYVIDSSLVAAATGLPVSPGYLQLVDGQPGVLSALPLPPLDSGPFYSYAWQWLIFGAMAVGGLVHFTRLEIIQRRRGSPAEPPPEPAEPAVPAGMTADRYGRRR